MSCCKLVKIGFTILCHHRGPSRANSVPREPPLASTSDARQAPVGLHVKIPIIKKQDSIVYRMPVCWRWEFPIRRDSQKGHRAVGLPLSLQDTGKAFTVSPSKTAEDVVIQNQFEEIWPPPNYELPRKDMQVDTGRYPC